MSWFSSYISALFGCHDSVSFFSNIILLKQKKNLTTKNTEGGNLLNSFFPFLLFWAQKTAATSRKTLTLP